MIHYQDNLTTIIHGDCIEAMRELPDDSIDAAVCDPPYGLEFMGKEWDKFGGEVVPVTDTGIVGRQSSTPFAGGGQRVRYGAPGSAFGAWCALWTVEALRVLKPGGHLLAFGGTRTWHRLAVAVEDAGFDIRDSIAWLYGSGFPKSLDVSKAIDKAAGATREVVGPLVSAQDHNHPGTGARFRNEDVPRVMIPSATAPATPEAEQWQGWGTALKPAFEPIIVGRKPFKGNVAANVLAHGTGALNIDATRIGSGGQLQWEKPRDMGYHGGSDSGTVAALESAKGRWPANVILDESQAAALDEQSGHLHTQDPATRYRASDPSWSPSGTARGTHKERTQATGGLGEKGTGASRFFYCAKAPKKERPITDDGTAHPTVKPLALMRWLVRLVTPPGGVVLDPFAGSGTTVEAALLEGFRVIGIERETDYLPLIDARIRRTFAQPSEPDPMQPFDFGESA